MPDRPLTVIQREALLRLVAVVTRTSRREQEVLAAREAGTRTADAKLEAQRSSVAARIVAAREAAETTFAREMAGIESKFGDAIAAREREWHSAVDEIEEKAAKRRVDADKSRQESIWLAESVFEATSNQPHEQFEQARKGLAGYSKELDSVEEQATRWLRACLQPGAPAPSEPANESASDEDRRAAEAAGTMPSKHRLEEVTDEARRRVAAMRGLILPRLFRSGLPVVTLVLPAAIAAGLAAWRNGGTVNQGVWVVGGATFAATIVAMGGLYIAARAKLHAHHRPLREAVAAGRRAIERCTLESTELRDRQLEALRIRRDEELATAEREHGPLLDRIEAARTRRLEEIEQRYPRQIQEMKADREARRAAAAAKRESSLADAQRRHDEDLAAAEREHEGVAGTAIRQFERDWAELVATWREQTRSAYADLALVRRAVAARFAPWNDPSWERWAPPSDFPDAIPFGRLRVDLTALDGGLPRHADLALPAMAPPDAGPSSHASTSAPSANASAPNASAPDAESPGPAAFDVPALLGFPEQASLLVQAAGAGLDAAVPAVQSTMFRLLTALPPSKVRFVIVDPVGLGQNFAGFMHLADDDGALVTDRIWTEDRHIDQRLLDITEHMENVIQKYLRNEYETIGQYNLDAGEIAEPYRFLVAANLPANFSEASARRLMSIAASGPRCGVFTLITADTRAARPPGLQMDDLARAATTLRWNVAEPPKGGKPSNAARSEPNGGAKGSSGSGAGWSGAGAAAGSPVPASGAGTATAAAATSGTTTAAATTTIAASASPHFVWDDPAYERWTLTLDDAPPEALLTRILKVVGREAKERSRVEVPFSMIAPPGPPPEMRETPSAPSIRSTGLRAGADRSAHANGCVWWSRDSANELRVALGRAGATKLQDLMLGQGVSQHVLIAGKTGSGKSTLLHAIITNLAMWYSPEEVEFYLVDFKKGVEFKTYASNELPHARAVAIESDREFGLSVLQKLDAELRRRGEIYRDLGVQDLAGYRRAIAGGGAAGERLPRTLLIIDEFQEFFTEDDKIAQDATLLLDRLVRQGRAFGIHVILGSQTLGGAYSLARATIGQMAVRIALQCSESDSYLILSDDNSAARLLARPGEAIYNDQGGLVEGNNPFQIAWLGDGQRDAYLAHVRALAEARGIRRREPLIVFEGNIPADISRNALLARALADDTARSGGASAPLRAWLGDAIAIKDPTAAFFRRQSGANLLVVGQRDEAAVGMLFGAALSLLAQRPDARVFVFDGLPADAPEAGKLARLGELLPGPVRSVAWREVPEAVAEIAAELDRRQHEDSVDAPPIFLVVGGLQRFRMLRQEEEFGFSGGDADAPPRPDKQFGAILREGPTFGVHTLAWVDTVNNLGRTLDRQGMKEFEQRVLFQMSQADSSHLIDTPIAAKLGLHRAIYFSEESGAMEKFRPYATPEEPWLASAVARLRTRVT
ncbi:MAG: FtsK/SpoIIIE domain-containing protein [Phycisphaerales bacterium]